MEFINEKELKNNFGIYAIINKENNKYYIGQTRQQFQKRYWHHQWKLRNGSHDNIHLQSAWSLYGEESFYFEVLSTVEDVNLLNKLEESYIEKYRNIGLCYNIQNGGQTLGNLKKSEEHKKIIGEKNRINMLGKKHSEETKRKMSESRTGKYYNESSYILTKDEAYHIKIMLTQGFKPSVVAKELNIKYKHVNNIISSNAWDRVYVEGWDEFLANRKTWKRFSYEDCLELHRLYYDEGYTQKDLAELYGKTRGAIYKALKRVEDKSK